MKKQKFIILLKANPALIMHENEKKNENEMKNDQNYIYQFHYKGNVLAEPQGSAQHSLNTTAVEKGLKK
jgi:hypothetical protein